MSSQSMLLGAAAAIAMATITASESSFAQDDLASQIDLRAGQVESKVIAWRQDIHQHPELGNREFRTAELVAAHLKSLGLEVQTGVAHTGVVGLLRGSQPGPVVLLRADMDALPVTERVDLPFASKARAVYNGEEVGVMHACGHDTHVAILMGVAEVFSAMRAEIPGTIKFIFQPAEEGAPAGEEGGAALMVKEGVLSNPTVDAAFALHILAQGEVNNIFYKPLGFYASADDFRIVVKGRQSHGAYPWNSVDPIVTSAQIINALQTIVSRQLKLTDNAAVVTIGKIQGGVRSNIIPEQVEMIGTLRALDLGDRQMLHDRVRAIATKVAESMGATAEVQIPLTASIPVTYNNPELTSQVVPVLERVAGAGRVHLIPAHTGYEDFAFIAERVPSVFILIGGRSPDVAEADAPDHHTPDFHIDERGLGLGVRALAHLTVDYMQKNGGGKAQ